ncbi:hypothetical protein FVEG_01746 [Fusarium verticillioides 7600]|uniref:Apple domain-containing protein n=1 Tax=Gibberella moniliformis (strain M3125 / FGSC 7600) TaxID=334819 RepID=W7LSV5_GIBM7|nr:hypothetical protein FVEG_01746 [Fusarium verticillioides 7600]EWG38555.1 hypothetical protein FVEG_01746 [Fusarium verticillioides 7600]
MIAQNVLAAFVGLAVGVQAGPCKPSSVTTTTDTASTEVTSITSIATSGEPTTTTEAATTTTSPGEYVCLKDPAPVGKGCNARGGGQGDLQTMGNANTLTLASCYKSCLDRPGCIAISLQPGLWCALWAGSFTGTSGGESAWSWYDMDCFCDESSSTTSGLATGTTATEAITSELTTSSVKLTSTTETAPAITTTTAPGESCVNNERSPVPSDKVCNKHGYYDGTTMIELGSPSGANTKESCRDACHDTNGCAYFAFSPNQFCSLYGGTIEAVTDQVTTYIWYDMDCFCDLDEPDY